MTAPHSPAAGDRVVEQLGHPGFEWIQNASCASSESPTLPDQTRDAPFFVDAGRVIGEEVLRMCRACPVRRECILHSYFGGPGGTMIGAGYFGGFSLGQRKSMTVRQALAKAKAESEREGRTPQQGTLI